MAGADWIAVKVEGADGPAPLVLACEHASAFIPSELDGLGLAAGALETHVAWDIGAAALARALSRQLGAPLVSGCLSRLVYDCNRPPEAPDAIPSRSESYDIPGNRNLDDAARRARHSRVHAPFHAVLAETCREQTARAGRPIALVTVHSFTPVFLGRPRAVEIGFLHHADARLAGAMLAAERARGRHRTALNEPYSARDGVTHTLALHGEHDGRQAAMIEVRNDLLANERDARRMGDHLAATIATALGLDVEAAG